MSKRNPWLRPSGAAGVIAPAIAFTCIILAILSYPDFNWMSNALSDLGVQRGLTAPLFNYGLIVSGLLAVVFAVGMLSYLREKILGKAGAAVFILATIALVSIGLFPENVGPMHYYASVAFFLLVPVAMIFLVAGFYQLGRRGVAWFTLLTGLVAAVPWVLQFAVDYVPNVAIPETISAVSASAWSIVVGSIMLRKGGSKT